jgi:hypothetical protein
MYTPDCHTYDGKQLFVALTPHTCYGVDHCSKDSGRLYQFFEDV